MTQLLGIQMTVKKLPANPNPGPGGWGVILVGNWKCTELASLAVGAELTAAIQTLQAAPPGVRLWVMTDSEHVFKGITIWSKK
jgi:ribonuclease HI